MTAMGCSAATGSVGVSLGDSGFQHHQTGAFDRVQTLPASASEPVAPNTGLLVHNLANDRHGAFDLNATVPVRVALLPLMLGVVA
jgi:hypothetical protein